jgi:hypothetical protein
MLTADTITDEQIRELMRDASDHAISVICRTALSRLIPERFDSREQARARCAEILNARVEGK